MERIKCTCAWHELLRISVKKAGDKRKPSRAWSTVTQSKHVQHTSTIIKYRNKCNVKAKNFKRMSAANID